MKKYIFLFLLLAGTARGLHAQNEPNTYKTMFDLPKPGAANGSFKFFYPGKQTVMMEMSYASQFNYLPNLDSVLQNTMQLLEPLKDSLKADGIVRRVDMVYKGTVPAIRIVTHPEYANTYTVQDKELVQLKVNQDTVRIVVFTKRRSESGNSSNTENTESKPESLYPFVITLVVNNVEDIANIPSGRLSECVAAVRPKIDRFTRWDKEYAPEVNYRANFNMNTGQMYGPFYTSYTPSNERGFQPIIGFGLNAVRGAVAPFLEGGIEFAKSNAYYTNRFRLTLEAQTFFSRDSAQKLRTFNNSFIDIGYRQTDRPFKDNKLQFVPNVSIGYLFRRSGEWYEKNTFRLGLPQLAGKNFSLTPQIVFNDFFKNVTIGFRFCFNF
jgi:hypothetical protein